MKQTFKQYLEERDLTSHTIKQYENIVAHFHRHLNSRPICKKSVYDYLYTCHQTQSYGTNNYYRNALRCYFKYLSDTNQSNIHDLINLKNKRYSFLPKFTTKDRVFAFTYRTLRDNKLSAMEKLVVLLIKNHGIQNKFFPHIKVSDYELYHNRLRCPHMEIELSSQEQYYIQLHILEKGQVSEREHLFTNRYGMAITSHWISSLFSRLQKRYGITMTSSMLRNYFVIECINHNMPLLFISRYIGRTFLTSNSSIFKLQFFSERILMEKQQIINDLRDRIGGEQHNVFKKLSAYLQIVQPVNTRRTASIVRAYFDSPYSQSDNGSIDCEHECSTTYTLH